MDQTTVTTINWKRPQRCEKNVDSTNFLDTDKWNTFLTTGTKTMRKKSVTRKNGDNPRLV